MISACRNLGEQSSHDALYLMGARNWQYGEIAGDISQEVLSEYSQIFSMFDGNGDGLVNLQEYLDNSKYRGGDLSKIFAASDRDGDGVMTEQEYINNRIITDEAKVIFNRMDANSDNVLSEAEFLADCNISDERWAKELFKELDPQSREASSLPEFLKTYGDWAR
jgi:Ca2+-binding EF-hand superfamily protein